MARRDFSREFEGRCCETDFEVCDWTCEEIQRRIQSRAPIGSVYTRGQIDTQLNALRSQLALAIATNTVIIDAEANLPAAIPTNAGYFFLTNDPGPIKLYISDGSTWVLVVDEAAYTAQSTFTGDMEKATYDVGDDGRIDVAAGGTGQDFSGSTGNVIVQAGVFSASQNYESTRVVTLVTSEQLTATSPSNEIFSVTSPQDVYLPITPTINTYFRLINATPTIAINIREAIGDPILITLDENDGPVADFHYDGSDWQYVHFGEGGSGTAGTDELVSVSSNDTAPGRLLSKVVAGADITITEQNDGGNEFIEIAFSGTAAGKFSANIGNGADSSFLINHNLNTRDLFVTVYTNSAPYDVVLPSVTFDTVNDLTVDFGTVVPALNEYRITIRE